MVHFFAIYISYFFSNLSSKYTLDIISNSFVESSGTSNEYIFLESASIIYFIASFVVGVIFIAPLSSFPHDSHLNPLSLKLKYYDLVNTPILDMNRMVDKLWP